KCAVRRQNLNATVLPIGDVDEPVRAQGNPVRALEFSDRAASPTQLPHEGARRCKHLDAVVPRIGHVDQTIARKRETQRATELAGAAAGSADARPQPATLFEYADRIRVVI